jgi:hypothetical protein
VTLATKATQAQQSTQPAAMEADGLDAILPGAKIGGVEVNLADLAGAPGLHLGTGENEVGRAAAGGSRIERAGGSGETWGGLNGGDFGERMAAGQEAAARARARGETPRPRRPGAGGSTSMKAYDEYLAEQEAKGASHLDDAPDALLGDPDQPWLDTPLPPEPATPKQPRIPIWMKPVQDVPDLPGFRPPSPAAAGGGEPPKLPSGRAPSGFGEPRGPIPNEPPLSPVDRALAEPGEDFATKTRNAAHRLIRETYDRIYPLRELDTLAGTNPNTGAHAAAQIVSGAVAAGEDVVRRTVMPLVEELGGDAKNLERYWLLRASEDVLTRYPHARLPGGIDGWGGVLNGIDALKKELGPERFAKIEEAASSLWRVNDEHRLKPLLDEGIISKQEYTDLKNSNPHYLPFHRYEYAVGNPRALLPGSGATASYSGANLGKRTKEGSSLALDQPMVRWTADIIQTQREVSRNRAARAIVDGLRVVEAKTGEKMVAVASESPAAAAGLSKATQERGVIRYFDPAEPGVQKVANVPEVYATVARDLEAEPANTFLSVMNALATPLRAGATALNLAFLPRNLVRDAQSAYAREGLKPTDPVYWQALKAAFAKNSDFSEAAMAGVFQSGLLESRKPADALKRAQGLQGITVKNAQDAALLLPRLLGKSVQPILRANEIIEQTPRLATFLKLTGEGKSTLEAAVRARDVTVDFSKSGNFVRMLNQMAPFLNARIQGSVNAVRAVRDNPMRALVGFGGASATASVVQQLWNSRFESANTIPQYEFDKNWVFIVGEGQESTNPREPNKPGEKFPIIVRVPKSDIAAVFSAPVEAVLRAAWAQDDRSAAEHAFHALRAATSGISPVDPSGYGGLSLVAPPIASTGASLLSNYDAFRGRDIVPQGEQKRPPEDQFGGDTSKVAVALGQQFKVSPRMIDFAIRSYTGGAGGQALWLADLALGALGYDPEASGDAFQQPRTMTEEVARAPGISGILGVKNTEQGSAGRERFGQAAIETQRGFNELAEVHRLGVSLGEVGDSVNGVPLKPAERAQYQRGVLQAARDVLPEFTADPEYRSLSDQEKRLVLIDLMRQLREEAAAEVLGQIPDADLEQRSIEAAPVPVGR